jgi:hypothetical protein
MGHRLVMHHRMGTASQVLDVHPSRQDMDQQLGQLVARAVLYGLHPDGHPAECINQPDLPGEVAQGHEQRMVGDGRRRRRACYTHLWRSFLGMVGSHHDLARTGALVFLPPITDASPFVRNLR